MDIDDLKDVRAIILSPRVDCPELAHPEELDLLIESYGPIVCLGAVGHRTSQCLVLGAILRLTTTHVRTINGAPLPEGIQDDLRAEYRELVPTDA